MGNAQGIRRHYENATKTGVFQLKRAKLNEFPEVLIKLKSTVRSIDLSENKLKRVHPLVGDFVSLKKLNLNHNEISSLPDEIGQVTTLEVLSLNHNCITSIPSTISNLNALRQVHLNENELTSFPLPLAQLKNLEVLDLSRNKIISIPEGIGTIRVHELNLNQNQLSYISEEIASASRLKVLRIQENCLTLESIPTKLLTDSNVSLLAAEGNLFEIKDLHDLDGYELYLERYTATKKKLM